MGGEQDAGRTFSHIYDTDAWEGGSGVGSTPDATAPYREVVARLLGARDVRTVVDVGCGDWQLGSLLDLSGVQYTGVDVVPSVVAANTTRYGRAGVAFAVVDARTGELPPADLLLVKDVLQHWPNDDVWAFLARQLPRYRYVLATNDLASVHWDGPVNAEMELGGWRTLDLEAPPFDHRATWRRDFEVRGEWTKRMTLFTTRAARLSRALPGSALRRLG